MNYTILKKVSDQLNEEVPDISYIRGMIETLLSFEEKRSDEAKPFLMQGAGGTWIPPKVSEIVDLGRVPNLLGIKDMVDKSLKTE